ncbi:hypothetical protein GCM10023085_50690 [Actinomadura viridis]|uniref:Uncharacterized protein n=1 Tax=Actinomadura viridis TaxID=58110 RepID=A0A931DPF8_9ACTN|nr:hypothetical protein [Actinomadura viridis]MBG6092349.1 hypothetical protein [Actinomadura viridis]
MTRDRDKRPRRAASADDAFLEVTGAQARARAARTQETPPRSGSASGTAPDRAASDTPDRERAGSGSLSAGEAAEAPEDAAGAVSDVSPEEVRERLRRRAIFLRELAEARELRRRVTPHRSRRARIHAALRRRTFRIN